MDVKDVIRERDARQRRLAEKWAYLIDGIKDPTKASMVAQLLENQSRPLVNILEADQNTGNLPTAAFPARIALPTIVQVFPALAANELVQVQAMPQPTGLVLYQKFIRSSNSTPLDHDGSWTATAESGTPPKARMKFDTMSLSVSKYMLNMQWTAEVEEDAEALGNVDIQAQMIAAMRDEVAAELDGLIIDDLYAAASASAVTGPNGMQTSRAGAGNVNWAKSTYASYETPKAHQETLLDALIDLKVQIYNSCLRHSDFIVGNAAAVANIEKLSMFAPGVNRPSVDSVPTAEGAVRRGTLAGQWDVYVSSQAPNNKLLMGVKRAGYLFGVYRPFELTPTTYDNNTDEYIRGVRTRVARQTLDAAYYGTLTIV